MLRKLADLLSSKSPIYILSRAQTHAQNYTYSVNCTRTRLTNTNANDNTNTNILTGTDITRKYIRTLNPFLLTLSLNLSAANLESLNTNAGKLNLLPRKYYTFIQSLKNYNCTYEVSNIFDRIAFPRIILNKELYYIIAFFALKSLCSRLYILSGAPSYLNSSNLLPSSTLTQPLILTRDLRFFCTTKTERVQIFFCNPIYIHKTNIVILRAHTIYA